MAQTIAERASFITNLIGSFERDAAEKFERWTLHRDACWACSKDATNALGGPVRCGTGDSLHAIYSNAEREYCRRLIEVTT